MTKKKTSIALLIVLLLIAGILFWRRTAVERGTPTPVPMPSTIVTPTPAAPPIVTPTPPLARVATPAPRKTSPPKPAPTLAMPPKPAVAAVPVPVHKELIPKNIEVIRIYYENQITGPDSLISFDINGSGFNQEFEKMISVRPGTNTVHIQDLALVTPNQIRGLIVVGAEAATGVHFPEILIQDKVVFRSAEPFAVIRPGEVLDFFFTEMSESGRSGKFTIYANLTQDMFNEFSIVPSTPTMRVFNMVPNLPFMINGEIDVGATLDATRDVGAAPPGAYGVTLMRGKNVVWSRAGLIRVVKPNLGKAGLVQSLKAEDEFHRPGDRVRFQILGTGFVSTDVDSMTATVEGLVIANTAFVYRSPGRMDLSFDLPSKAETFPYSLRVLRGGKNLISRADAFRIVDPNWTRGVRLDPALTPGGRSTLTLMGRDLDPAFVQKLKIETDSDALTISPFQWKNADEAVSTISATPSILPGDYWIRLSVDGKPVTPQSGSIIKIEAGP